MRKTFIIALAFVFVLALAATAYASTTSGYEQWGATGANVTTPTPHKGYTTATNKCAVCHAVHKATDTGEVLLRSSVDNACTYCHITNATGNIQIYGADAEAYDLESAYAHNPGGGACARCHSVHGADTLGGANNDKILKNWVEDGSAHAYSTNALAKWTSAANISSLSNDEEQITAWCTGCHKYYIQSYDQSQTSITYTEYAGSGSYNFLTSGSHVMTDLAGGYTNPATTITSGTAVAWGGSEYCRSCHDAGMTETDGGVVYESFPHYTPSYYRFMEVAADVTGYDGSGSYTESDEDTSTGSGSTNTTGTVDGLCLKCHRDGVDAGVGLGY